MSLHKPKDRGSPRINLIEVRGVRQGISRFDKVRTNSTRSIEVRQRAGYNRGMRRGTRTSVVRRDRG
jgi:hypothetical protein